MHEIKINRTSGQQSCPLISGLNVLSMSTANSWLLKRNALLDYSQIHILDRYRHTVAEYSIRDLTIYLHGWILLTIFSASTAETTNIITVF